MNDLQEVMSSSAISLLLQTDDTQDNDQQAFVNNAEDFINNKEMFTSFGRDIVETLFENETQPMKEIKNDQLSIRDYLVGVMKNFANYYDFNEGTMHLATVLLDIYMKDYILSETKAHQKFVAIVALFLAAKSEDIDDNIPSIKEILYSVDLSEELDIDLCNLTGQEEEDKVKAAYRNYNQLYCTVEFLIFQSVGFNTIRPTCWSFIEAFYSIIVTEDELNETPYTHCSVREFMDKYLDIVLFNIEFNTLYPSKVAASVIAATRNELGIKPIWNEKLHNYLRASYEDISFIVDFLISKRLESNEDIDNFLKNLAKDDEDSNSCVICEEMINGDSGYVENCCHHAEVNEIINAN